MSMLSFAWLFHFSVSAAKTHSRTRHAEGPPDFRWGALNGSGPEIAHQSTSQRPRSGWSASRTAPRGKFSCTFHANRVPPRFFSSRSGGKLSTPRRWLWLLNIYNHRRGRRPRRRGRHRAGSDTTRRRVPRSCRSSCQFCALVGETCRGCISISLMVQQVQTALCPVCSVNEQVKRSRDDEQYLQS